MNSEIIPENIRQQVKENLKNIEAKNNVKIILACESGSRAWGFSSKDSDFDVRFIYANHPDWYFSIQNKRDVIEVPIDDMLDISGWDLKKTFNLLLKSNPPLLEWLSSPIIYTENKAQIKRIKKITKEYFQPMACHHHYLNMANNNFRHYLHGESVWTKKYLYVLRPILACKWIEKGLGIIPMEFQNLVDEIIIEKQLKIKINELLELKKKSKELDKGPRIPEISQFIDVELKRMNARPDFEKLNIDITKLDKLFREIVKDIWK